MRTFLISVLPVLFTRYIFLVMNPKISIRIDHIENGSPPQYSILGSLAIILIIFFSISSMVFLIGLCLWNFLHHFIQSFFIEIMQPLSDIIVVTIIRCPSHFRNCVSSFFQQYNLGSLYCFGIPWPSSNYEVGSSYLW